MVAGFVTPNVIGNRRADEMLAEDQAMNRRVRLTVRLGLADSQSKCNTPLNRVGSR